MYTCRPFPRTSSGRAPSNNWGNEEFAATTIRIAGRELQN
jgi:hypothetical protein